MKSKNIAITLLLFLLLLNRLPAQVDSVYYGKPAQKSSQVREKPPSDFNWRERLSFGGNFMVWFGQSAYVYLSPTVNLKLLERLYVGAGFIYNYNMNYWQGMKQEWTIYGPHTYAMAFVTKSIFAKIEYNYLNQPDYNGYSLQDKIWVNYIFAGGGFSQRIGERSALYSTIMFNLSDSPQTYFYPNPIIQVGILAGF